MAKTVNYQCPACTGPLHFSANSGKLECEYCGSVYETDYIEKLYREKEAQAASAEHKAEDQAQAAEQQAQADTEWGGGDAGGWSQEEAAALRAFNCPSCGAEIVCEATTAATACAYCGNPTVVPGRLDGILRPDYVIPFKMDKNAAVSALKAYYKGKRFLPSAFSAANHIEELQGIYVPFWLFNGTADAQIQVEATRSHVTRTRNEEITTTEHFHVTRAGTIDFRLVPVDGSEKMPDDHMDTIEPYDYRDLTAFSTAYLPGYLAHKYDVSMEECGKRADRRVNNTAVSTLMNTVVGYDTKTVLERNVDIRNGSANYALLPVWMLRTKWKGKDYLFAMNGQTGKLVGDLPVSAAKFAAWFAGISLPLMVILALILHFLMGPLF